jgi:hypothetical protein
MVKTVKGIYEHGEIRLLEDPHISGTQEVYIVFPAVEQLGIIGIPASTFRLIDSIVSLGGHALEDSERLWEEDLSTPSHA